MGQNIRLGKIAGIPIEANWSVLVIFFLFTWELAALVLPSEHPHDSTGAYWIAGIVTTILLFASLVAHEVSHTIVAQRNGVKVRKITLWLFGGISELEGEAVSPGVEFRIAVIGPVVTFACAALFALALWCCLRFGLITTNSLVADSLGWLVWINVFLGVFNLIPAAPLDGGRVLRAAVWQRTGDRARATEVAARTGQAFGYILVILGVLEFFTVSLLGLWMVFLGWFILVAARSEERTAVMRDALANVHVRDLMTANPVTFPSSSTVGQLLERDLHQYHFGTFPLVGPSGDLEGLTTMARIRKVPAADRHHVRLIDTGLPLSQVPVAPPGEPVIELLQRMEASPDGRALVVDGGKLVGVVSPSDVSRFVQVTTLRSKGTAANR